MPVSSEVVHAVPTLCILILFALLVPETSLAYITSLRLMLKERSNLIRNLRPLAAKPNRFCSSDTTPYISDGDFPAPGEMIAFGEDDGQIVSGECVKTKEYALDNSGSLSTWSKHKAQTNNGLRSVMWESRTNFSLSIDSKPSTFAPGTQVTCVDRKSVSFPASSTFASAANTRL